MTDNQGCHLGGVTLVIAWLFSHCRTPIADAGFAKHLSFRRGPIKMAFHSDCPPF